MVSSVPHFRCLAWVKVSGARAQVDKVYIYYDDILSRNIDITIGDMDSLNSKGKYSCRLQMNKLWTWERREKTTSPAKKHRVTGRGVLAKTSDSTLYVEGMLINPSGI